MHYCTRKWGKKSFFLSAENEGTVQKKLHAPSLFLFFLLLHNRVRIYLGHHIIIIKSCVPSCCVYVQVRTQVVGPSRSTFSRTFAFFCDRALRGKKTPPRPNPPCLSAYIGALKMVEVKAHWLAWKQERQGGLEEERERSNFVIKEEGGGGKKKGIFVQKKCEKGEGKRRTSPTLWRMRFCTNVARKWS